MDFELSDEQKLIRATAREFTDKEIVLQSRENARNHHFDTDLVAKIAAQGYLGAIVPTEYGGAGLGLAELCIVGEELAAVCLSTAATVLHQADMVVGRIARHGSAEQKQRYLPRIASGEYTNISFIHEVVDRSVEDVTEEILAEAALPEVTTAGADLQADRLDHARDLRKHEAV